MIDLPCSLTIEATEEPDYFGFYSPDLESFTGIGHSIEDCIYWARWGMKNTLRFLENKVFRFHRLTLPQDHDRKRKKACRCLRRRPFN